MKLSAVFTCRIAALALSVLALPAPAQAAPTRPIRFDRLSLEQGLSQSDGHGHPAGPARLRLAGDRGRPQPLRRDRLQGLQARPGRRRPRCRTSFVWDVEEDAARQPLDRDQRRPRARGIAATDRIVRQESVGGRHIRALRYAPEENVLWIGTRDSGLLRWTSPPARSTRFAHDARDATSLIDDRIYALVRRRHRSASGSAPSGGLDRFDADGKGFDALRAERRGPDEPRATPGCGRSSRTARAPSGWARQAAGLEPLDVADRALRALPPRRRREPTSLAHDQVRAILQDADGRLWVGTTGGLDLFDRRSHGTFAHYRQDAKNPSSLADDHVLSLAQDRGGVLWVGTRLGGVHKWNPLSWQFGHVAPDPDNAKRSGQRLRHVLLGGPRRPPVDRHLRCRPLRDGPASRRDDGLPARREEPARLASDQVMALLPRPPRRPLDRHVRRRTRSASAPPTGAFKHYRSDPKTSGGPQRQRRHLDPRGRRRPALARHLRRRPGALRSRDGALHALSATTPRTRRA